MKCPNCGHGAHRVLRTAEEESVITRTRECNECGKQWKTSEVSVETFERANGIVEAFRALSSAVGEE